MAQKFSVEASAGYIYSGLGGQLAVVAEDLAPGLPLAVRLGLGFATSDALDDNYNIGGGTTWGQVKNANNLTEWGQNITLSLDVLYKLPAQGLPVSLAPYLGLRYNMFEGGAYNNSGWLKVSSNAFGFGGGIRAAYAVIPNLDVVADLGADYYLQSCITASSSSGSPSTTCPGGSGYANLNAFVTQPDGFVFRVRLGAAYRF
jgi:CubicO group peptidase (beta-lactamase class C family)